jgi:peptide-methionine (S)-S-oxide reductase
MSKKSIVLGGGCFWCTEAVFQNVSGISKVTSGYAGGHVNNPTYKQVSQGQTGHAEVVKVEYDNTKISLEKILLIFFKTHNPTTHHRQGADVGTQYRSVILFGPDEDEVKSENIIEIIENENIYNAPIITEVEPLEQFWKAEDEHQNYFKNNPNAGYCTAVIAPKMTKLKEILEKTK